MSETPDPNWEKTLEARGIEAVRVLLARSRGAGDGAVVEGLGNAIKDMPTRGYAESWVVRKETEHQAQQEEHRARQERLARANIIWAGVGAFAASIAALIALLAWIFPIK